MADESKLMLGTVQFGLDYGINNSSGKVNQSEVDKILSYAYSNGIHFLDTAEAYGDSQQVLGQSIIERIEQFKIVSKYASTVAGLPHKFIERVKFDLEQLKCKSLYGYLFHSHTELVNLSSTQLKELQDIQHQGLIKKLGVSVYTNEELEDAMMRDIVEIIQLPFNLLDNGSWRGDLLRSAKEKGIEIHTRSVFLQGLFFKKMDTLTGNLLGLTAELKLLQGLANEYGITVPHLALQYALSQGYIDKVLIGVDSLEQLEQNVNLSKQEVDKALLKKIDDIRVNEPNLLNPSTWRP